MRKPVLVVGLILASAFGPHTTSAQEQPDSTAIEQEAGIGCEQMVFCAGVKDKTPVGVSDVFPSDIYRVYCYTTLVGARDTTAVVHTWYRGEARMAAVELSVKGARWRTWSTKRMTPGWQGTWRVDVSTTDGRVIGSKQFSLE